MAYKDLHEDPFDESTIAKLEIFEDYAQAWIPTFVMQGTPVIHIFDFFAGTGYDKNGVAGSPIRILKKVKEQIGHIFQKRVKIVIHLNEYEPQRKSQKKFEMLQKACADYLETNKDVKRAIELKLYNKDFTELFPKLLPQIIQYPSLVYLDQNGIKFLSDKYFLAISKTKQTDFLYFVSASYLRRFGDSKEFKTHLDLDLNALKKGGYKLIHRNLIEQLKTKLPLNSKIKLYPFSLQKGQNIYGIIFGASHPRAVEKFLNIAWKKNEINGEANFDIDDDAKKGQMDMFLGLRLNKVEKFKKSVKEKILSKEITNNFDLYNFTIGEGHIGKHASDAMKEMKKRGEIDYSGSSPLVTYDNVYKLKKKIIYQPSKILKY